MTHRAPPRRAAFAEGAAISVSPRNAEITVVLFDASTIAGRERAQFSTSSGTRPGRFVGGM